MVLRRISRTFRRVKKWCPCPCWAAPREEEEPPSDPASGSQEENKKEQKNQPEQQELLTEASPLRTGCRLCLRRCCAGRPRVAPQPARGSREEEEEEQKDGRQQQELLMEASALWRVGRWCLTCCCAGRPRVAPEPASTSEEGKAQEEAMEEPPQKEEDVKKEEPPQEEEEEKEQQEEKDHPAETSISWGSMVVQAPRSVRSSLAEAPPHLMSDVESIYSEVQHWFREEEKEPRRIAPVCSAVTLDSMPLGASAVSRNSLDQAFKPLRITESLLVATSTLLDVEAEELSIASGSRFTPSRIFLGRVPSPSAKEEPEAPEDATKM